MSEQPSPASGRGHNNTPLLDLDPGELDHPGPLLDRIGDDRAELRGRAAEHRPAELDNARSDPGVREAGIELPVEQLDDVGRRVLRRTDAGKAARLVAGH